MIVRVPVVLRRYSGGEAAVAVEGETVAAALDDLFRSHPDLKPRVLDRRGEVYPYLVLFRNDRAIPREGLLGTALEEDDVVEIVAAAEGG